MTRRILSLAQHDASVLQHLVKFGWLQIFSVQSVSIRCVIYKDLPQFLLDVLEVVLSLLSLWAFIWFLSFHLHVFGRLYVFPSLLEVAIFLLNRGLVFHSLKILHWRLLRLHLKMLLIIVKVKAFVHRGIHFHHFVYDLILIKGLTVNVIHAWIVLRNRRACCGRAMFLQVSSFFFGTAPANHIQRRHFSQRLGFLQSGGLLRRVLWLPRSLLIRGFETPVLLLIIIIYWDCPCILRILGSLVEIVWWWSTCIELLRISWFV